MQGPRLLIAESEGFSPRAKAILEEVAEVTLADVDRRSLLDRVPSADVLWVRLRHRIDAEILDAARQLSLLVSPTTGLNHIDLATAKKKGVHVVSLKGETEFLRNIRATAEHTILLMLALLRHAPAASEHVRDGGWDRDLFKGDELYRKCVGLVGFGRLGRIVAKYLQAFDATVIAHDPYVSSPEMQQHGVRCVDRTTLLNEADIVSLHVALNRETTGLIGAAELDAMKTGAWLINTARGELVDESALLAALTNQKLRGAAVDVLCDESALGMAQHPLVQYAMTHANLLITPHIGGCTVDSMRHTEEFLAERVSEILRIGRTA